MHETDRTMGRADTTVTDAPDQDGTASLELVLVDPDGARPSRVIDIGACFCVGFGPGLTWAPDGSSLAFTTLVDNAPGLYIASADGTNLHLLSGRGMAPLAWRPIPPEPHD